MKVFNILSIDDDPKFNALLKAKLDKQLFKIISVTTVKSFLDQYKNHDWDLFLIDINISEGENAGFKVIKYIREKLNSTIPIITFSKLDDNEKIAHALDCGSNDYLTKPFDEVLFMAKTMALLDAGPQGDFALKGSPVPAPYRKGTIITNFNPHLIKETGIELRGEHFISKGTNVYIKDSFLNEITNKDSLRLFVVKNSMIHEGLYSIFLEFEDEETIEKVKTYIMNRQGSASS